MNAETPLTLAAAKQEPRSLMMALVSGGAYLDFRNRHGLTPMHVAAHHSNRDAIRVSQKGIQFRREMHQRPLQSVVLTSLLK